MKKLATGVVLALVVGGSAMAENLSFGFGTNFFKPNDGRFQTSQGTSFLLSWTAEEWTYSVLNENTNLSAVTAAGAAVAGTLGVSGIRVSRSVVKLVTIGLGIGAASVALPTGGTVNKPAIDVVGTVNILSSKGDKVSGSFDAIAMARFINLQGAGSALSGAAVDAVSGLNGTNLGLAVTVGF
ncbi:MAG: hypothetical protein AAB368_14240 [bacterium]